VNYNHKLHPNHLLSQYSITDMVCIGTDLKILNWTEVPVGLIQYIWMLSFTKVQTTQKRTFYRSARMQAFLCSDIPKTEYRHTVRRIIWPWHYQAQDHRRRLYMTKAQVLKHHYPEVHG